MPTKFSRSGGGLLFAVILQVRSLPPDLLAGLRAGYDAGVGIMCLAADYDLHPDVVAMAVRGYGYKGYQMDGTRRQVSRDFQRRQDLRRTG